MILAGPSRAPRSRSTTTQPKTSRRRTTQTATTPRRTTRQTTTLQAMRAWPPRTMTTAVKHCCPPPGACIRPPTTTNWQRSRRTTLIWANSSPRLSHTYRTRNRRGRGLEQRSHALSGAPSRGGGHVSGTYDNRALPARATHARWMNLLLGKPSVLPSFCPHGFQDAQTARPTRMLRSGLRPCVCGEGRVHDGHGSLRYRGAPCHDRLSRSRTDRACADPDAEVV